MEEEAEVVSSSAADSAESEDVKGCIGSVEKLIGEKQFGLAITMLEKAVEKNLQSSQLWILYLQLKSRLASSAELPELYMLCHKAVISCQSYAVVWEVSRSFFLNACRKQLCFCLFLWCRL